MVDFIPPLQMETWFLNVLSGDPEVFTAIALLAIASLAEYFRMNGIGLFFIMGVFLIMFSGFINSPLIILILVISGLLIGLTLSRTFVDR